jgi:endogenous inhibitor of DNA gyrase (YacG/DUF329 family)
MSTGSCPVCGQSFTSEHYRIPRRRYCSERCRKTAWRRRHPGRRAPRPDPVARPDPVPHTVPRPGDVTDLLPGAVPAPPEPTARCPHCARPVAVITLLVAPAAAQVPPPQAGRHG